MTSVFSPCAYWDRYIGCEGRVRGIIGKWPIAW
jgi:hypothetical protein